MSIEYQNSTSKVCEPKPKKEINKQVDHTRDKVFERIPMAQIILSYDCEIPASERLKISHSRDDERIFRKLWNPKTIELQEQFGVLLLNNSNQVLGFYPQSLGGMTSTLVDVRLIMISALNTGALGIIVCHNHPSGSVRPSLSDRELTQKIKKATELLDIEFLDHIILTREKYFSFADNGEI